MNEDTLHRCVLLTGATGFLGAQIARRLLRETDLTVIAVVRAEDEVAAARRLARAWWDWPEMVEALTRKMRVEAVSGDVSLPHLGLDEATYSRLAARTSHVIHAAADVRLDAPIDELRKTNVQGTANVLELAHLVQSDHGLTRYAHVSTAYVAGGRSGTIPEADLTAAYGFNCAYELSKYEGECLVRAAGSDLPISVFRPGMIVGATDTGEIRTFNTVYYPLRLYLTGKLPIIPSSRALRLNVIPVDYVAEAIVRLTLCPEAEGLTFHLTAPAGSLPQVGELMDLVRAWAHEHLGLRLRRPWFVRLPLPKQRYRPTQGPMARPASRVRVRRNPILREISGLFTLLPYFDERKQFLRDNVDRLLGPYTLNWREFLPRLLAYAVDHSFMHRSERTVHEQLLVRLESKSRPLRYFDIVEGKVIQHSGGDVRREILAAARALTALGILPGDRVAIVGLNSTRTLALDTAIGLVGAVSVPLYTTSPPDEIDHILLDSGARLLLVGAPKILGRLDEIRAELPIVSFCREPVPPGLGTQVVTWDAFLAQGAGRSVPLRAPVGFGDLATLFYTSGTTGQPKGVSFRHQQLRWIGKTMASLMPWKPRNKRAQYLSYLPMSHVVEGILATYCPYYVPAPVDIYFLDDLKDLPRTLSRVHPTIFFSVPRIYEKIWETLEAHPVGRLYAGLRDGVLKRALGALLRWQTLRKAGLDRCAQLIVGSAPCGEGLLQNFRDLGIEVHDAYGMTEAPLVTLNRLGANRPGTVGTPLPETEARVAEDGEVWVRGPQVMAGYFGPQSSLEADQPFRDGWLRTGDLGYLSPEGSLILNGRKSELFKTSYGEYVHPAKVEARLREISGVTEAMLVGRTRPYCVALMWIDGKILDAATGHRIDRAVGRINRGLSHAEQVRRWAVLSDDLSIEAGDLTGNLKLRRQVIARRLDLVIQGLYNGTGLSPVVLHAGEAGRA